MLETVLRDQKHEGTRRPKADIFGDRIAQVRQITGTMKTAWVSSNFKLDRM